MDSTNEGTALPMAMKHVVRTSTMPQNGVVKVNQRSIPVPYETTDASFMNMPINCGAKMMIKTAASAEKPTSTNRSKRMIF